MSKIVSDNFTLEIYGASHAEAVGMTLCGIKAGESINLEELQDFCDLRKSVNATYSTSRGEPDVLNVLEGIKNGKTTGGEIRIEIKNQTARRSDYATLKDTPRPSHADYVARMKFGVDFDMSGGGKFSGRMTAPLCIAGGIAKQLLEQRGVEVGAYVTEIGGVKSAGYRNTAITSDLLSKSKHNAFRLLNCDAMTQIESVIDTATAEGDSVGGVVEAVALNVPVGLGDCLFDGLENEIAKYVFAIPAVKGLEFGAGFGLAAMKGSEANDPFRFEDGKVVTLTNNSGGINGGISNGMPVTLRVAFRPTPSISKEQQTVNLKNGQNVTIKIEGRHDVCIVPRAAAAVEAAVALAILSTIEE